MIKELLKNNGITLTQLAGDLKVSRPTLDSYIKSYEAGEPIPNELYAETFAFLFDEATDIDGEFVLRYEYIKTHSVFKRSISFVEGTDGLATNTKEDARIEAQHNYYADYMSYKTGVKKVEGLNDEEKKFFTTIFKLEDDIIRGDLTYDEQSYLNFKDACNRAYQGSHPDEYVMRMVQCKLDEIIREDSNLDVQQLLKKLKEALS